MKTVRGLEKDLMKIPLEIKLDLNKLLESIARWFHIQCLNSDYKKKTQLNYFGLYWRYEFDGFNIPADYRKQRAIAYCPNHKIKLTQNSFYCSECHQNLTAKEYFRTIQPPEAVKRMTIIFEGKNTNF